MKAHTIHEAKTNLSRLIEKAHQGEEVIIARGKKPVAKIVPIGEGIRHRVLGGFEGKITWTEGAFDPLTDEEMTEMGFE
jgi:prevent-host-death family protein